MLEFNEFIDLQEKITEENGKFNVYDSEGKELLGSRDTKKEALAQLAAIEISKAKNWFNASLVELVDTLDLGSSA